MVGLRFGFVALPKEGLNVRRFGIRVLLAVATSAILAISPSAYAIVGGIEDTTEFGNPGSDWYHMTLDGIGMVFDGAGQVGGGSAVAVGNRWFLSAAHFAINPGYTITMSDGRTYTVEETFNAPPLNGQSDPVDLRLVKVAEQLPQWYGMYDGQLGPDTPVIMAGTGYGGTTTSNTFMYSTGVPRAWRWGTNAIDGPKWMTSGQFRSSSIEMGFKRSDSTYEAGFAVGDSGAGTFLLDDGKWKLVGINAYIDRTGPLDPPPYNASYAVIVPTYIDWINTIVPTGNLNADDIVDADDIDLLYAYIDSLGGSGSAPPADPLSDLNSDGLVDGLDMDFLITEILDSQYGDFNLDGRIDLTDLSILGTYYGLVGLGYAKGDANGNGVVDLGDLTILGTYYGFDASANIDSVPEPASMALMGAGALLALRRRRRA